MMCYSVMVKQDLKLLQSRFGAIPIRESFARYEELSEANPKKYKPLAAHGRIYPNYYAPIIVAAEEPESLAPRLIRPMRYRIRPHGSAEEVPTKYNMFNARLDALTTRRTWKGVFGRRHGILVFEKFFEWVPDPETGKKKVVAFSPKDRDLMWSPVLWDRWTSVDGKEVIESFAIITGDPPPEVRDAGHDRCPIFLQESLIGDWLSPRGKSPTELVNMLKQIEPTYFECAKAA